MAWRRGIEAERPFRGPEDDFWPVSFSHQCLANGLNPKGRECGKLDANSDA